MSGDGIGDTTAESVSGGWRISVEVPEPGDYTIAVTCADSAMPAGAVAVGLDEPVSPAGGRLPATGGGPAGVVVIGLVAVGLAIRRGRTESS